MTWWTKSKVDGKFAQAQRVGGSFQGRDYCKSFGKKTGTNRRRSTKIKKKKNEIMKLSPRHSKTGSKALKKTVIESYLPWRAGEAGDLPFQSIPIYSCVTCFLDLCLSSM